MLKRDFILDMKGNTTGPLLYYFHKNIQKESERRYIELNVLSLKISVILQGYKYDTNENDQPCQQGDAI